LIGNETVFEEKNLLNRCEQITGAGFGSLRKSLYNLPLLLHVDMTALSFRKGFF